MTINPSSCLIEDKKKLREAWVELGGWGMYCKFNCDEKKKKSKEQ